MWIRDKLPQCLPIIRFIVYGYDTTLKPSNSFQTIPDLTNSLIDVLRADGWTSPTAKPLLFLAHSLGGVLLKQTLLMLAGSGQRETSIANLIRGAVFFGVPSRGMPMTDVLQCWATNRTGMLLSGRFLSNQNIYHNWRNHLQEPRLCAQSNCSGHMRPKLPGRLR